MRTDGSGGQAGGGRHQRNRTQTKGGAIHIRPRVVGFNAYTISKFVRGILGRSRPAQTAVVGRGAGGIPCETPSTPTHLRHFSLGSMICHRFFQFFRRWPRFHSHPERANRLPPPVLLAAELSAPLISIMMAQTCIVSSHCSAQLKQLQRDIFLLCAAAPPEARAGPGLCNVGPISAVRAACTASHQHGILDVSSPFLVPIFPRFFLKHPPKLTHPSRVCGPLADHRRGRDVHRRHCGAAVVAKACSPATISARIAWQDPPKQEPDR